MFAGINMYGGRMFVIMMIGVKYMMGRCLPPGIWWVMYRRVDV